MAHSWGDFGRKDSHFIDSQYLLEIDENVLFLVSSYPIPLLEKYVILQQFKYNPLISNMSFILLRVFHLITVLMHYRIIISIIVMMCT